ncbi:MAG: SPFH domain-containing protein [Chloroflexi bacterium]|nr:SPFH domain-containing protein [Chloroflexota bacterium]MCH8875308.1 SPFH domain-containing protein [Chloroflexota bacterium]MCI0772128.1 SPFH domain-containing protein [Chloroflexota bacterium]MCI0805450.1 SPFH domain-containing protein [Chloroflexota bacterium]MCI0826360.1 SPFH domain-containing protein [Chloroflexota bacterium]
MARIFDIVEYPNEMQNEFVRRIPEVGSGDFRIGSQLIVREAQSAVFFRDGKALDTFGPGRHTLTTANIPLVVDVIGKAFGGETPFKAEVYFISMREFANQKWGTPQPILVRNPGMGLGLALLQSFGTYGVQVADAQQFVTQLVGAQGAYGMRDIQDRLRAILLSSLQDLLGETTEASNVPELIGLIEEIGAGVRAKCQDDFRALGLTLKAFYIESLKPSDKSAEELRDMGMLDIQTYTQLQAADAMRDAAQNPSGGAGLTAGIGAGMGIGSAISEAVREGSKGTRGGVAASAAVPDVMTPSEAAQYLKVSEEDVISAIDAGDIKAKKIGKAVRISRTALDEFLNS